MPIIGISVALQLACVVHCMRGGKSCRWISVILLLSIPGCLVYIFCEVLPPIGQRREVRLVKQSAIRKLDPEREIRAAREQLATADTAANHLLLGDALAENGQWGQAASHYETALSKSPAKSSGADEVGQVKLAEAYLEAGKAAKACKILEEIPDSFSNSENDRRRFLHARCLDQCGETERALAAYRDLGSRLPGGEAQCRRAALLISAGRKQEAIAELEEVELRKKRVDRYERARNAEMYAWANHMLQDLRGMASQEGA